MNCNRFILRCKSTDLYLTSDKQIKFAAISLTEKLTESLDFIEIQHFYNPTKRSKNLKIVQVKKAF